MIGYMDWRLMRKKVTGKWIAGAARRTKGKSQTSRELLGNCREKALGRGNVAEDEERGEEFDKLPILFFPYNFCLIRNFLLKTCLIGCFKLCYPNPRSGRVIKTTSEE